MGQYCNAIRDEKGERIWCETPDACLSACPYTIKPCDMLGFENVANLMGDTLPEPEKE